MRNGDPVAPCQGCMERHVGCHNAETCAKWAEYRAELERDRTNREERVAKAECVGGYFHANKIKFCEQKRKRNRKC